MPLLGNIVEIEKNGEDGTEFPFTASCLLGRKLDCDIRQLPQMLDVHCKIELNENNKFILTNLSSVNPTCINGQVLNLSKRLKHGDVITTIDRSYRFECPPPKTPTAGKGKTVQALQEQQEKNTPIHAGKRKSKNLFDSCLKDGSNLQTSVDQSVENYPLFELCQKAKQHLAKSPRKSELPKTRLARPQVDQEMDLSQQAEYLLSLLDEDITGPAIPQSSFHASQEEKTSDDMPPVGSITPSLTEKGGTLVSQKKRTPLKTPQKFSAGKVVQQILLEPQHEDKTPKSPKGRRSVGSQDRSLDLQMPLGQLQSPGPIVKKTKVKMSPRTSVRSNAGNRSEVQGGPHEIKAAIPSYKIKGLQVRTAEFIKMRAVNDHLFTGNNKSDSMAWGTVLKKMGLLGKATTTGARRKWKYLKKKYKDCKCKKASAETWPWFALMDEVLGQRHSTNPPVLLDSSPILLDSSPEDTSGSSSAVDDEDEEEPRSPSAKGKKGHVDELVERRWKQMSILNLLEPYITDRDTSSNFRQNTSCDEDVSVVALLESMTSDESTDESTQTQADTTQPGPPDSPNVPPLWTPKTSRRTLASKRRAEADQPCVLNDINSKPDEEEHFLLSLAGALRHLPPCSRSEVKMKFQQILHDAEFNNQ